MANKKLLYISYPFSECDTKERTEVIMLKKKYHSKYRTFSAIEIPQHLTEREQVEYKMTRLIKSSAILMCLGWDENPACQTEYNIAVKSGKKIIFQEKSILEKNEIINTINDLFSVDVRENHNKGECNRKYAKLICTKLLRDRGVSFREIAVLLKKNNHSCVIPYAKEYEKQISTNKYFQSLVEIVKKYLD